MTKTEFLLIISLDTISSRQVMKNKEIIKSIKGLLVDPQPNSSKIRIARYVNFKENYRWDLGI